MIHVHASGHLIRDPQTRQTKTGNEFVTAMIATDDLVLNVSVFDTELCAMLMRCKRGDGLSVAGKAAIGTYTDRNGETKPSAARPID